MLRAVDETRAHRARQFAFFINQCKSLGDVRGELFLKRTDVAAGALWPRRAALIGAGAFGISTRDRVNRRTARHKCMGHRRATVVSKGRK
jgi:hypothetical protein